MTEENRGGSRSNEELAPVIPLFGGARATSKISGPTRVEPSTVGPENAAGEDSRSGDDAVRPTSKKGDGEARTAGMTASPTPVPGNAALVAFLDGGTPSERHPARGGASSSKTPPRLRALRSPEDGVEGEDDASDSQRQQEVASESLVRKLRARSLSISEARMVLKGHHLDSSQIEDVIDEFTRRGYLDDATLAEQLVDSGSQRKGQGRVALSRALAQRGIPRDVIDTALGELPDDDADRALEFARSKARSLSRLDADTALRRLMGQLARRGYGGSVAMSAAKTALAEETFGGRPTGVRFVDSD